MIIDPKIEIGDIDYSKLSDALRFKVSANGNAVQMVKDICGRPDMSVEEVALEMAKVLESAITIHYHRGGRRIKYD
jgi:hypothetical protein|tara:strand:+ start:538 stop:765 length:228 start_codon:yes stop_codon:yes gene_type:complete